MVATVHIIIAASSMLSLANASPSRTPLETRAVAYKNYKGDGTVGDGWPDLSDWADFETLWSTNIATSAGACKSLSLEPNSDSENTVLKAAIKQAGTDSGLDPRFILAAVFQESTGCVRVKTSYSSNENIRNPGLLQCDDGEHTCNDEKKGISQLVPCPDAQIKGMITDGVGLTTGWGLKQVVKQSGASDVSKYYKGALLYNSGVMPEDGNLGKGRSNACYSSDIANRVMGWVDDQSPCNRDTIGDL
ncbi:unnamed protein product [Clonostachys rosea]|uniref:Transglycosylase SLT domain-containing protein n=1 Tax=Bionectria ochroleuca TaxID=29856 RepID=A0ABY6TRH0_BIOOC|nr:unnamed protein product [Clonostachys rosea]